MPLRDVVLTLERWYNVDIRLADSTLGRRRLTATFKNESIDLVLKRIGLTLGLRVERAGESLLLRNGS
jgi:ferric-dicitrate binding protein FerR (iron transport regulator)